VEHESYIVVRKPISEAAQEVYSLVESGKLPSTATEVASESLKEISRRFGIQQVVYTPFKLPEGIKREEFPYKMGSLALLFRFNEPPTEEAVNRAIRMITEIGGVGKRAPMDLGKIYPKNVLRRTPVLPAKKIDFFFPVEVTRVKRRTILGLQVGREKRIKGEDEILLAISYYPLPEMTEKEWEMTLYTGAKRSKYQGEISVMLEDIKDPRIQQAINILSSSLLIISPPQTAEKPQGGQTNPEMGDLNFRSNSEKYVKKGYSEDTNLKKISER